MADTLVSKPRRQVVTSYLPIPLVAPTRKEKAISFPRSLFLFRVFRAHDGSGKWLALEQAGET